MEVAELFSLGIFYIQSETEREHELSEINGVISQVESIYELIFATES